MNTTPGRNVELPSDDRDHVHPRLWLKWAATVLAADLIVHNATAVVVNEWEGWGVVAAVFLFVLVTGLVIVGLTFGLLVRWGLKPSPRRRNRAAIAAVAAGLTSLAAYAVFFTWAPALVAPAALVLAREGLRVARDRGGRGYALTGATLGASSLAMFLLFLIIALITGDYPFGL